VAITTVLSTFLAVFITLLVKTPEHAPSKIDFVNYAAVAATVYACIGCSSALGGGINPAASLAVMWAQYMQLLPEDQASLHNPLAYWISYLVFPFFGGALAGYANRMHVRILELTKKKVKIVQ
jgi:glycerol uptake facilitator-like aquaporin